VLQHLHNGNQQTAQANGTKRQGCGMVQGIVHGVIATTTTTSISATGFIIQLNLCWIMEPPVPNDSGKFAVVKGIKQQTANNSSQPRPQLIPPCPK